MTSRSQATLALVCALMPACEDREQVARAEAAQLVHAVEGVRQAPHDGKGNALDVLRGKACSSEEVCSYKDTCVRAYERHVAATDRIGAVRAELSRSGDGMTPGSLSMLEQAQKELTESKALAEQCVDLGGKLTRKYQL